MWWMGVLCMILAHLIRREFKTLGYVKGGKPVNGLESAIFFVTHRLMQCYRINGSTALSGGRGKKEGS